MATGNEYFRCLTLKQLADKYEFIIQNKDDRYYIGNKLMVTYVCETEKEALAYLLGWETAENNRTRVIRSLEKHEEDALDNAWQKCDDAVEHVGMANYAEREVEAKRWVAEAFEELKAILRGTQFIPKEKSDDQND